MGGTERGNPVAAEDYGMGSFSIWHWLIVIVVVMLMFGGRGKISGLRRDFAQGIRAFKKGMAEDDKTAEATDAKDAKDAKSETVKTIDHNAPGAAKAKTEQRAESAHS